MFGIKLRNITHALSLSVFIGFKGTGLYSQNVVFVLFFVVGVFLFIHDGTVFGKGLYFYIIY